MLGWERPERDASALHRQTRLKRVNRLRLQWSSRVHIFAFDCPPHHTHTHTHTHSLWHALIWSSVLFSNSLWGADAGSQLFCYDSLLIQNTHDTQMHVWILHTHAHTHTNTDTAAAAASEILIPIKMQLRLYVSSSGSSKRCSFVWFFCTNTSLRWDKMEKLVIWRRIYCVRCISGSYFKHPAVAKHYFSMWREKKQIYLHYFSHLAWCLATMEVLILTWAHLK